MKLSQTVRENFPKGLPKAVKKHYPKEWGLEPLFSINAGAGDEFYLADEGGLFVCEWVEGKGITKDFSIPWACIDKARQIFEASGKGC